MFLGLDIGSVTTKAALISSNHSVLAFDVIPTTFDRETGAKNVMESVLSAVGASNRDVKKIVATGYGRKIISFRDEAVSEIICHAEGTVKIRPEVRTIIDIGGQDSKVIALNPEGKIDRFEMNDKCAAGTGRFLEVLAERILDIELTGMGPLSLNSRTPCVISSVCTIFAESEVVSYLSEKRSRADITAGLHLAIAKRIINMGASSQIRFDEPVCFSGGVAKNTGVVRAISEQLGKPIVTLDEPQLPASLGAAILAERMK